MLAVLNLTGQACFSIRAGPWIWLLLPAPGLSTSAKVRAEVQGSVRVTPKLSIIILAGAPFHELSNK